MYWLQDEAKQRRDDTQAGTDRMVFAFQTVPIKRVDEVFQIH